MEPEPSGARPRNTGAGVRHMSEANPFSEKRVENACSCKCYKSLEEFSGALVAGGVLNGLVAAFVEALRGKIRWLVACQLSRRNLGFQGGPDRQSARLD